MSISVLGLYKMNKSINKNMKSGKIRHPTNDAVETAYIIANFQFYHVLRYNSRTVRTAMILNYLKNGEENCVECGAQKSPQWRALKTTKFKIKQKVFCNRCGLKIKGLLKRNLD